MSPTLYHHVFVCGGKRARDSGGFSTSSLVQEVPVENLKYDNFIVNITTTPLSSVRSAIFTHICRERGSTKPHKCSPYVSSNVVN
jgi:hypothetical protein